MAEITKVGEGKVVLIAGGGKIYTDIAARFCRSSKSLDDILASPYDKKIVKAILDSGHLAATEFDNFIFGIEGYSRVTEAQLIRKRIASYLISSGRVEKHGNRKYELTLPESIMEKGEEIYGRYSRPLYEIGKGAMMCETHKLNTFQIIDMLEDWYDNALAAGIPEQDARYLKPQATSFKAICSMNTHGLVDWFKIRLCNRAQDEIHDLAMKMYSLCLKTAPDLFAEAGPSCKVLGFCPEMEQCEQMKGKILPLKDVKTAFREGRLHIDEK